MSSPKSSKKKERAIPPKEIRAKTRAKALKSHSRSIKELGSDKGSKILRISKDKSLSLNNSKQKNMATKLTRIYTLERTEVGNEYIIEEDGQYLRKSTSEEMLSQYPKLLVKFLEEKILGNQKITGIWKKQMIHYFYEKSLKQNIILRCFWSISHRNCFRLKIYSTLL